MTVLHRLILAVLPVVPLALFAADAAPQRYEPGIELPDGAARALVLRACTRCHDLRGVPAFRGYWTQAQWLAMIETMVKHGAALDAAEAEAVAAYLARHFGRGAGGQHLQP